MMSRGKGLLIFAVVLSGAAAPAPSARIEPKADEQLRRMSDYLGSLQSFRMKVSSVDESVMADGQKIQQLSSADIAIRRPNRLRTDRREVNGELATYRYDGKEFSVIREQSGLYAKAPVPDTLGPALDVARDKYGIQASASDLIVPNAYKGLTENAKSGQYIGVESVDGVLCHHLAFKGDLVDWQIWIEDGPRPMPRRYVITTKGVPGQPQFTATITDVEPKAVLPDSLFEFHPPPGAKRIPFAPTPAGT